MESAKEEVQLLLKNNPIVSKEKYPELYKKYYTDNKFWCINGKYKLLIKQEWRDNGWEEIINTFEIGWTLNGQKQGDWIENGNGLVIKSYYINNKLNGPQKIYKNNYLIGIKNYTNGFLDGTQTSFYTSGMKKRYAEYKNSKLLSQIEYNQHGNEIGKLN